MRRELAKQAEPLVFFDFVHGQHGDENGPVMTLVRSLARLDASVQRVAVGRASVPQGPVNALRAGANEFLNLDTTEDLHHQLQVLIEKLGQAQHSPLLDKPFRSVLLMGARIGVGCSTAASSLAWLLQQEMNRVGKEVRGVSSAKPLPIELVPLTERVGLLDLGAPTGDCALYMGLGSDFDFIQAASQRHRMDDTMLHSALAQHSSGLNLLSLPADVNTLNQISLEDSLGLCSYLRERMGCLVIDAGGFPNPRFLVELESLVDEVLVVTDQSMGALVSLAEFMAVRAQFDALANVRLVVNQFDPAYGFSGQAIAERFGLELAAVLPDRRLGHMRSAGLGKILVQVDEKDPYTRALQSLASGLTGRRQGLSQNKVSSVLGRLKFRFGG
ncbi:pilus assembly protein CpaF [Alcaligenes faecalis]|uniref:Pilus assembly protein CpaF n=1 Tax=Alcaligenes faecalis TaxID=511 RepID=A0AB33D6L1_ALCFA|nr:pilus assembly protein CpaF [Alcaligenes faecalis]HBQ89206.1 pilus assembly protein CpaF [Alcaligenes faecalis]